jgi:hypothetical protein
MNDKKQLEHLPLGYLRVMIWPITIALLIFIYRAEIGHLIENSRITSVQLGPLQTALKESNERVVQLEAIKKDAESKAKERSGTSVSPEITYPIVAAIKGFQNAVNAGDAELLRAYYSKGYMDIDTTVSAWSEEKYRNLKIEPKNIKNINGKIYVDVHNTVGSNKWDAKIVFTLEDGKWRITEK